MTQSERIRQIESSWQDPQRWNGIRRPYTGADVYRLAGSVQVEHTLAQRGARHLWSMLTASTTKLGTNGATVPAKGASEQPLRRADLAMPYVAVLSAITGNQAVQEVQAGLPAIYVSGWQVAADGNTALETYPDQSLYPADAVPALVRRLNNALMRADEIHHMRGESAIDWVVPLVADAEAGFGGTLNAFELMKAMIEAGAAGVHFEDQLSSVKKCGHLGGKVLVPTREFISKLVAARLAADVSGVETVLIARTDAHSATLLTSDVDPADAAFLTGERTAEGFYGIHSGIASAIARALSYAPYADVLWFETSTPDLAEAREFSDAVHRLFPGKVLAYNCSPSFNWRRHLNPEQLAGFQRELGEMGYKFQFVTLSGFHALNHSIFTLARAYRSHGMAAYAELQEREFSAEQEGYEAVRHQEFVGTGYFDEVMQAITEGQSSTLGMRGSTEVAQFK